MELNIIGTCTTADTLTDMAVHWDRLPYDMLYTGDGNPNGSAVVCQYNRGKKLLIKCPGCGHVSFTGGHRISDDNKTVTPSLVMQCCGWHGWLKAGVFTRV